MSRLLHSRKPIRNRIGTPPDSDPVLLESDLPAASVRVSESDDVCQEDQNPDTVPFIEIPEPADNEKPAPIPDHDKPAKPEIRFEPYPDSFATRPGFQSTAAGLIVDPAHIAEWRPAVHALWQTLQQVRAASLLLVSLERDAADPLAPLCLVNILKECTSPLLLVEVDHTSGLSDYLRRTKAPGWTDWLAGLPLDAVVQNTELAGLHYLGPGHHLAIAQRRFWTWDWQARMTELRNGYPLIVWWTSATSAWVFPLAMLADATCFLTQRNVTRGSGDSLEQALSACSRRCLGWLVWQR
jgi:diadenosine tetraphosphatase ApaH/serine/threonine PP2A family protein phosphatase